MSTRSICDTIRQLDLHAVRQQVQSDPASLNRPTADGRTPLSLAAWIGDPAIVAALIEAGADIHQRDRYGRTALHWAANHRVAPLFITHGARLDAGDEFDRTPLHMAVSHGDLALTRYLLEHGARVNARDAHGETALHLAAFIDRVDLVELLLMAGADLTMSNCDAQTPYAVARAEGHEECVSLLKRFQQST